jgi:hypothetical protein
MDDEGNNSENSKAFENERQMLIGDALLTAAELANLLVSAQTISALTNSGVLHNTDLRPSEGPLCMKVCSAKEW